MMLEFWNNRGKVEILFAGMLERDLKIVALEIDTVVCEIDTLMAE